MKKIFVKIIYKKLLGKIFNPFLAMNVKPIELELKKNDKCLVVAPHPDDESIGCGGILSLYPNNFEVICLTHGGEFSERKKEFENAMEFLNVKHSMLNLLDKHVINGQDEFTKINFSEFDYIFIPYIFDQHQDHKAVSVLLNKCLKNLKSNSKIVFYEVWSTINMPNYFVDITSVVEQKQTAINCHITQTCEKDYATKILGLNKYRGMLKNTGFVETFTVLSVSEFKKIVEDILC